MGGMIGTVKPIRDLTENVIVPYGRCFKMMYPTIEQVNAADHTQICTWYRFLPSPGISAIGNRSMFEQKMQEEGVIMDRIAERLKEFGGFTPEISKRIGW